MPRAKNLRKQLKISFSTPDELMEILETEKFKRLVKPQTMKRIMSIKIGEQLIGWGQINHGQQGETEIERLEILPQYEGKGFGKKVLGQFTAILLKEKARRIILHGGKANGFYNKTNFRPTNFKDEREAVLKKQKRRY
jgi:ribosomal protein S18 acetylase RimI-like enzyme